MVALLPPPFPSRRFRMPCTPPSPDEIEALALSAAYLLRASSEMRSALLLDGMHAIGGDWRHDVPAALVSAGHLCEAVVESASGSSRLP